jgi:hypothetical protein
MSKRVSKVYKPPVWKFPLPVIDHIEDGIMVQELEERFSLKNLQAAIAAEPDF